MLTATSKAEAGIHELHVDVVEQGGDARRNRSRCEVGSHILISPQHLHDYCLRDWEPLVFDAFLLAAAVEFCDRSLPRSATRLWGRRFRLRLPVHEPERWTGGVGDLLTEALEFLTGDSWHIDFRALRVSARAGHQRNFDLEDDIDTILPYSEGLDSRIVSELEEKLSGKPIARVRLGPSGSGFRPAAKRHPFGCVPFKVRPDRGHLEASSRSRGFKFAVLSGMAAYLKRASRIVIPESGQGSLGPSLLPVGQIHADYRNHPVFTRKMSRFLDILCPGHSFHFLHPRLWQTKGETLQEYLRLGGDEWRDTRSCWQNQRRVSIAHKRRQCGVCAACMLRRLAVHAAGQTEPEGTYTIHNLGAPSLAAGAAPGFSAKWNGAFGEYALAGALHMDHLAGLLESEVYAPTLRRSARQLAKCEGLPLEETEARLRRLLDRHACEWQGFLEFLGPDSFVTRWTASR